MKEVGKRKKKCIDMCSRETFYGKRTVEREFLNFHFEADKNRKFKIKIEEFLFVAMKMELIHFAVKLKNKKCCCGY